MQIIRSPRIHVREMILSDLFHHRMENPLEIQCRPIFLVIFAQIARDDICHKQRLCKIITTQVKFLFLGVF